MHPQQKILDKQNEPQEESKVEICYIHKIGFVPIEDEEPIPFAGVIKFLEYKCPMCESRPQDIRHYETE